MHGGEGGLVPPSWKTGWRFLRWTNRATTDPAMPPPGIYLEQVTHTYTKPKHKRSQPRHCYQPQRGNTPRAHRQGTMDTV